MKNILITPTSLGGFVGPQAEAEVLVLRGKAGEGGRLGLWARGPCHMKQALTPVDRAPGPHKETQASSPGLSWLSGMHQLQNGEWTPGKAGLGLWGC